MGGREAQTIQMERGVTDDEAMGTEGTALKGTTREGVRAGSKRPDKAWGGDAMWLHAARPGPGHTHWTLLR